MPSLWFNKPLCWAVALCMLISSSVTLGEEGDKEQLEKVRDQMQHIQSNLDKKQQRRTAAQEELENTEKKIGAQNKELKKLDHEIAMQQKRIRATKVQQGLNRNSMESQRKEMGKQIRTSYIIGRQDRMKLLLNQQSPEMVGRMMVYHDYFNRIRVEQLDLIQATLERLQQSEQTMLAEERKLQQLQEKKQREKRALEASRKNRKELIVSLSQDITSDEERLRELKKDEQRLQKLLVQIQQRAKANKNSQYFPKGGRFHSQKGKMHWPTKGRFKAHFGSERRGGLKWDGVLISAPEGNEVKAVHAGKVVFADWLRGFGLMLILDHGDGYMTLYGHNQSLAKNEGDLVQADEMVASLGNSGGLAEPGVYFALRYNGNPINPEPWFK